MEQVSRQMHRQGVFEFILKFALNALALMATAWLFSSIEISGFVTALLVVVVIAVVNTFLKPLLVVLTIPVTIVTLGLFMLVINGFLFWLVAQLIPGFSVAGFWTIVFGALVYSILASIINGLVRGRSN